MTIDIFANTADYTLVPEAERVVIAIGTIAPKPHGYIARSVLEEALANGVNGSWGDRGFRTFLKVMEVKGLILRSESALCLTEAGVSYLLFLKTGYASYQAAYKRAMIMR